MTKTAELILEILLKESWMERNETISDLQYNDIMCWKCGTGNRENPNPNSDCQCENDE